MVISFGIYQLTLFPALEVLGPLVAKNHLGGAGAWAVILIAGAVGSLVAGVASLHATPRRPLVVTIAGSSLIAVQLALLGVVAPVWVIAAAAFVGSVGLVLSDNVWFTTLQANIPEDQLGRISSFDWLGSIALNPIGYALVGPLAAATSVRAVLIGSAAIMVGSSAAVAAVPSVRELRRRTA